MLWSESDHTDVAAKKFEEMTKNKTGILVSLEVRAVGDYFFLLRLLFEGGYLSFFFAFFLGFCSKRLLVQSKC